MRHCVSRYIHRWHLGWVVVERLLGFHDYSIRFFSVRNILKSELRFLLRIKS